MVFVAMTLTAVLWPFWLAVAAGIVLAAAKVLQAAEIVLAAVMARCWGFVTECAQELWPLFPRSLL